MTDPNVSGRRPRRRRAPTAPSSWWAKSFLASVAAAEGAEAFLAAAPGPVLSTEPAPDGQRAVLRDGPGEAVMASVSVRPLPPRARGRLLRGLATKARFAAALLSGRLPEDVDAAFDGAGPTLVPGPQDLNFACAAGDATPVCPHVRLVALLLAERLDADPFLAFSLRGVERDDLLATLRRHRAEERLAVADRAERAGHAPRARGHEALLETPVPGRASAWYRPLVPLATLRAPAAAPEPPDAVLARLGPPPLADPDAARVLSELHRAVGLGARERLSEWEWRRLSRRGRGD